MPSSTREARTCVRAATFAGLTLLLCAGPARATSDAGEIADAQAPRALGAPAPALPSGPDASESYEDGGVPVLFDAPGLIDVPLSVPGSTAAAWGPDGRLYVGSVGGQITSILFDDDWVVLDTFIIDSLVGSAADSILGITFDPFDPPGVLRMLVAHSDIQIPNLPIPSEWPYAGQVSTLSAPDWEVVPLITGLPVSNHDHGINGLDFDHNGDLYVCVGGNTNAGFKSDPMGGIPSTPLSGSIIKARTSKGPDFVGTLVYDSGDDQTRGDLAEILGPVDVFTWSTGHRNAFDLVFTTWELLYATDNGPNSFLGPLLLNPPDDSMPCISDWSLEPTDVDELNLIEYGSYHGYPNCNRARHDLRQYAFRDTSESTIPGAFRQALATLPSSTNGLVEYRAQTFGGALRGDLLMQQLFGPTHRVTLTPDKRSVAAVSKVMNFAAATDLLTGPGGELVTIGYAPSEVQVVLPVDAGAEGLVAYDIQPWRALRSGGAAFVIGGVGFGERLDGLSVEIDGLPAVISSVSDTRIRGIVPQHPAAPTELVDVVVTRERESSSIPAAFRFLRPRGHEPFGWDSGPDLPAALGEVSAATLGRTIYVVGNKSPDTFAYDLASETWSTRAPRPIPGGNHAAVAYGEKLYLFGGIGPGAWGSLQIYDSSTDSWTVGANVPWAAGSLSAVRIGTYVYVCGGVVSLETVDVHARYDLTTDSWDTLLAPMPVGRNQAAAGTDGRLMYVFGGRDGSNVLGNGFDEVQIYDPSSDRWRTSRDGIAALPQARGGMGAALYHDGEFYLMGGETLDGAGATPSGTYDRVDIFDPHTNTWRVGPPMPTARHGIHPVLGKGRIHVLGGGASAGDSASAVFELYAP